MTDQSNHMKTGIIFIAVTSFIGAALFQLTVLGSSSSDSELTEEVALSEQGATEAVCGSDEVMLQLQPSMTIGVLEILSPIENSGAVEQRVYPLKRPMCLPIKDLKELIKKAGVDGSRDEMLDLQVTWDPRGTTVSYRSRFDYDSETLNMDEVKPAPDDIKFGSARWNTNQSSMAVKWIKDFRQYQLDNFISDTVVRSEPQTIENNPDIANYCGGKWVYWPDDLNDEVAMGLEINEEAVLLKFSDSSSLTMEYQWPNREGIITFEGNDFSAILYCEPSKGDAKLVINRDDEGGSKEYNLIRFKGDFLEAAKERGWRPGG